jgi:hypothetical protein
LKKNKKYPDCLIWFIDFNENIKEMDEKKEQNLLKKNQRDRER